MKAIKKESSIYLKEVKHLKKAFVILLALGMLFAMTSIAFAKGNITPTTYQKVDGSQITGNTTGGNGGYLEYIQGSNSWTNKPNVNSPTLGNYDPSGTDPTTNTSTHIQGTWNSPYTVGIDGYNYNDPQDYVMNGNQISVSGTLTTQTATSDIRFVSGPHGGYLTSTHKCRECHAVHRAAGKFKLLRSDTRFEACDWCHGTGAGSGFNIQMDNDDGYTEEYNVGHTMGFGISSGKWKAPDDTYPAFTPNYWMGGFSCFDCHSPHANPARILGFNDAGVPTGKRLNVVDGDGDPNPNNGKFYSVANPGHDIDPTAYGALPVAPIYLAGSWLLIKNPDREIATSEETVTYMAISKTGTAAVTELTNPSGPVTRIVTGYTATDLHLNVGEEIPDLVYARTALSNGEPSVVNGTLNQYTTAMGMTAAAYPVNKIPTNWNTPIGMAESFISNADELNYDRKPFWSVNEFCTDCHDGNAGLHTVQAPLFSEDRALRDSSNASAGGNYDLAYGHDAAPRH